MMITIINYVSPLVWSPMHEWMQKHESNHSKGNAPLYRTFFLHHFSSGGLKWKKQSMLTVDRLSVSTFQSDASLSLYSRKLLVECYVNLVLISFSEEVKSKGSLMMQSSVHCNGRVHDRLEWFLNGKWQTQMEVTEKQGKGLTRTILSVTSRNFDWVDCDSRIDIKEIFMSNSKDIRSAI